MHEEGGSGCLPDAGEASGDSTQIKVPISLPCLLALADPQGTVKGCMGKSKSHANVGGS